MLNIHDILYLLSICNALASLSNRIVDQFTQLDPSSKECVPVGDHPDFVSEQNFGPKSYCVSKQWKTGDGDSLRDKTSMKQLQLRVDETNSIQTVLIFIIPFLSTIGKLIIHSISCHLEPFYFQGKSLSQYI